MRLSAAVVFSLCMPALVQAADYRAGWTAGRFYTKSVECESAIVLPAAQSYERKGISKGMAEETMRGETLSMVPLIEQTAAAVCHCALNQVAQQYSYDAYRANQAPLRDLVEGSACRQLADPSKLTKEQVEALRLK